MKRSAVRVRTVGMEYSTSHHPDAIDTTPHYSDVILTKASRITSLAIVYSTLYFGVDQRKHQRSASITFVRGIHRWLVNSLHKWPVTRKMFPFDDVIMRGCSGIIITWFIAVEYLDERFWRGTDHEETTVMNIENLFISQVSRNLSSIKVRFTSIQISITWSLQNLTHVLVCMRFRSILLTTNRTTAKRS